MSTRQLILASIILGLVAASVVWWLERFQFQQLHAEIDDHLSKHAAYQAWLKEQGIRDEQLGGA